MNQPNLDLCQQRIARAATEYNHIHNDLEAYLFHVAEWGLGTRGERPDPKSFGLPDAA